MKITNQQLKQIIKEELDSYLKDLNQARAKSFQKGFDRTKRQEDYKQQQIEETAKELARLYKLKRNTEEKIENHINFINSRMKQYMKDHASRIAYLSISPEEHEQHLNIIYNEPHRYDKNTWEKMLYKDRQAQGLKEKGPRTTDEDIEKSQERLSILQPLLQSITQDIDTLHKKLYDLTGGRHPLLNKL